MKEFLKYLFLFLCFVVFFSCAVKITPLKGSYLDGQFEAVSDNNKDAVWDKIIELFAKEGIPIRLIDRSSGLILSNEISLRWTMENKNGQPTTPTAYIVIQRVYDPGSRKFIKPYQITGEWNIRIKATENNKTIVNVNLVNLKYWNRDMQYYGSAPKLTKVDNKSIRSLGNFEKTIYEFVK